MPKIIFKMLDTSQAAPEHKELEQEEFNNLAQAGWILQHEQANEDIRFVFQSQPYSGIAVYIEAKTSMILA
jgi:hypothetical protein